MGDLDGCTHPDDHLTRFDLKQGGAITWCGKCGAIMTREGAKLNLQISNDPWNHPEDIRIPLGVHDDALLIAASRHVGKSRAEVVSQALRLFFIACPRPGETVCHCMSILQTGKTRL